MAPVSASRLPSDPPVQPADASAQAPAPGRATSEEHLQFILEAAQIGTWEWDIPSGSVCWSENMEEVHGLPPGSFSGTFAGFLETVHPFDRSRVLQTIQKTLESGGSYEIEYRQRPSGDSVRWMEGKGRVVCDASGRPARMIGICLDVTARKKAQEDLLRQISGLVLRLQDEERGRLARELHDGTAQTLSALSLNLALFHKISSVARHPNAARVLSESLALADQASRELRTLSYLLHPPLLDENGLAQALRWYIDGFIQRTKIDVDLEISPPDPGRLPQDLERTLLRIVQECLTNVYRHSQSSQAGVRLTRKDAEITLVVWDQGKGLPPGVLEQNSTSSVALGVGIRGMLERVKELHGQMEVRPGNPGTIVEVTLPAQAP